MGKDAAATRALPPSPASVCDVMAVTYCLVMRRINFAKAVSLVVHVNYLFYRYLCSLVSTLVMLLPSALHLLVKPGVHRFKLALVSLSSLALPPVSLS